MKSQSWLSRYPHKVLGALTVLLLSVDDAERLQRDNEAKVDLTGDTLTTSAFLRDRDEQKFAVIYLNRPLQVGENVMFPDEELGLVGQMVPFVGLYAGDGKIIANFGESPEVIDNRLLKAGIGLVMSLEGTHIHFSGGIADVRMVGDAYYTAMIDGDKTTMLKNVVAIGFSTSDRTVFAKTDDGRLIEQRFDNLTAANVDQITSWSATPGDNLDGIYRMGRVIKRDNVMVAPITAKRGGIDVQGELVRDVTTGITRCDLNDDAEFVITSARITDAKTAPTTRDPLHLLVFGEEGLGIKPIDRVGTARYASTLAQLQA